MEVDVLLQQVQVEAAIRVHVVSVVFVHQVDRALHDSANAGGADEHVVRFFGQHEPACAR